VPIPSEVIPFCERLILSTEFCFVVPTIGQIVEGYCLVFPKRPVLNLTELSAEEKEDFVMTTERVWGAVDECYGSPILFEHGAVPTEPTVGCGVNHAHLHIVPGFDLDDVSGQLSQRFPSWRPCRNFADWLCSEFPATEPYMIVGRLEGPLLRYGYGARRESQCIRRILASLLPDSPEWNWRKAGVEERLWVTQRTLRSEIEGQSAVAK
jgi:diadenosine tetraphosphate (Ap4A) HIT family hydrolase